ncbi:amidase domain-containing protein [Fonticella tunisiensis]|uniref:Putative amidase-like protein n=1 Tax=Fonticella tunisiensis TaxID=1096341 RepID=A0A4R7KUW9_9CLOT|nr:amidase domain-containing protein [Fonticella tunisiensis]TDT63291.1 putative amidase-like protein [Fonticella tunisiensis]
MYLFSAIKKSTLIYILSFTVITILLVCLYIFEPLAKDVVVNEEFTARVEELFQIRNMAMLKNNLKALEPLYDRGTRNGQWAYEHEVKKTKYLHKWADKQGIKFIDIKTKVLVRNAKQKGDGYYINYIASTEYKYVYENDPGTINMFRIGTYHSLDVRDNEENWVIKREWYTDPFADSLNLDEIKALDIEQYITSQPPRDFSGISERRKNAVKYADQYCGAAGNEETGYKYNKQYRDYNPQGGDCANFASQILYEGGKFKKTAAWNYTKRDASRAWVNAQGFKDYMINSGRASLIAYGTYNQVYKASYKLLPGDFVAYEKNGKVTHISVVTGADSKGYALVNCHNTDRYRVPWDLGWSDRGIKFYLVRVHY